MAESALIIDKIKTYLRFKGVTYKQLAKRLAISEATVKRWFSTGNLTLKQLDSICSELGTNFGEIINIEENTKALEHFTDQQEKAFDKSEKLLILFYLISAGATMNSIITKYTYEKLEVEKLALKLDQLNLIEYLPNNKFRTKTSAAILWQPSGLLSKKYFHLIREDFMNTYFISKDEKQWFYYGRLSKANQVVIKKKIDQLGLEIKELYKIDRKETKALNQSLFIGFRPWDFNLVKNYRIKP